LTPRVFTFHSGLPKVLKTAINSDPAIAKSLILDPEVGEAPFFVIAVTAGAPGAPGVVTTVASKTAILWPLDEKAGEPDEGTRVSNLEYPKGLPAQWASVIKLQKIPTSDARSITKFFAA